VRTVPVLVLTVGLVVALSAVVGYGVLDIPTVLLVLVLLAVVLPLCAALAGEFDPWLWWVAGLGFIAKLIGSGLRYFVLVDAYEGVGDAAGYHAWGESMAELWRLGTVPGLQGGMGEGTQVVRWITGFLYAPHTPSMLGGFFIFATLAFFGQLLFYSAFRRSLPGARLGIYAFFIFFLPGLVFWPSSIGKESLMIFFLGLATYGLARSYSAFSPTGLVLAGAGLLGAGAIRPHVAALLAGAFAVAVALGRTERRPSILLRRVVVLTVGLIVVWAALGTFGDRYGVEATEDLDPFVSEVERRTQQGGSAVEGEAVLSPAALPSGAIRVLFRPLPYEAHNLQAMASAVESTLLLGFVIWKLPAILRRIRTIRTPFVLMSAAYTVGFVIAFSAVFNLGILARQRAQVLPYLLAVVVAMGWDAIPQRDPDRGRHLELAA
jgi:hypothetical protein